LLPNQRLKLTARGGRLREKELYLDCGRRRPQLKRDPLGRPRLENVPRTALLLCLTALACRPFRPTPAPYAATAGREPTPAFYTGALAAAGIPNLATSSLPAGYRELRLSTGHGMMLGHPYSVLRILQTPTSITGEVWWVTCSPCRGAPGRSSRAIDWDALLHRLDSLEVPTFRPPPTTTYISDVGDLIVEVLVAGSYRGYVVNAPLWRHDPHFNSAQIAFRLIDSIAGLAPLH
jgi:hypothetical protein